MLSENHSVPATSAGFVFQFERAMLYLSQAREGDIVGIETLDDVTILCKNGTQALEQDKLTLNPDTNPLTNKSKNLWNTLSIWVSAVRSRKIDVNKTRFFIVTNTEIPRTSIINRISDATDEDQVDAVLKELDTLARTLAGPIKKYAENIFTDPKDNVLSEIIKRITFIDGSTSTHSKLIENIGRSLQIPHSLIEKKEQIINELLGWIITQSMNAWKENKAAWIPRDYFVTQFHAQLDSIRRSISQARTANLIKISEDQFQKQKGAIFVKQVQLVSDEEELATNAINDYIRYKTEKIRLSEIGDITSQDWLNFSSDLREYWKRVSLKNRTLLKGREEKEIGLNIFFEATNYKENLAGAQTEQAYLTTGELHSLSDNLDIGWHPNYKSLLKK